jgi:hypothetical protein
MKSVLEEAWVLVMHEECIGGGLGSGDA